MCKILILMVVLALSGCLEKRSQELIISGNSAKKHKESELVPEFRPVNHNDTIILNLESTIPHEGDTGTTGVDIVTYEFTHSVNQEVCLEKHADINYQLVIKDSDDKEITKINDGECETVNISEGLYHFHITHTSLSRSLGETSVVLIRPLAETTHCDNYKPLVASQVIPEETVELKNDPCSDPLLTCTIPNRYEYIPSKCTLPGPWLRSETNCTYYTAYDCGTHKSNQCSKNVSGCQNLWKYKLDNLDGDCGDQYDNWGPCYTSSSFWVDCFGGKYDQIYTYKSKIGSIIKAAYKMYVDQYCTETVFSDCNNAWKEDSNPPDNCTGFQKYVKYGDLDLKSGEVAIYQREYLQIGRNDYLPKSDDVLMVLDGKCNNIPHRIGAYIAGPQTQIVIYPFAYLGGKPLAFTNDSIDQNKIIRVPEVNIPEQGSLDPTFKDLIKSNVLSLTVTRKTGTSEDECRVKDVGIVCDSPTQWDIAPKTTGEVLLVKNEDGRIGVGKNCSAAFLFDYRCDDLDKLGLTNYATGPNSKILKKAVVYDSYTVLRSFSEPEFKGDIRYSQGQGTAPYSVYLGTDNISSVQVYKLPNYNHTILISLRKCCGCDLKGVDFTGDDLSNTVLVGSNMKDAVFNNTNLTGSDLRKTSLVNAKFNSVKLGDNHFGCADLSNVDMSNPSDSSKSTAVVSGSFDWEINTNHNNIQVSCDKSKTNLTSAKIPVQILPKNSWKTINLQRATLLDKVDGYDLSGIDLSYSDFTDLKAGGKVMNMQGADLSGSNLTNADFSSIDFSPLIKDKNAQYSNFLNTKIGGTSFANANLEGADFKNVSVDGISASVNFSYALMINTVFADADLGRVDFSYAYFFSKFRENVTTQKKAKAENIIAQDGVFTGSFMSNMKFTNATFKNCNFNAAQLVGTTFSSGDLSNSKFSDAYLQGADTTGALLTDASFSGAYLSLKDGYWHYSSDDAECSDIRINYNKTKLGDTSTVICPNGEKGPCDTDEKLSRKDKKIVEPPCVDGDEDIFGDTDCITHEYLEKNTIPKCDQSKDDVMQCGCLIEGE